MRLKIFAPDSPAGDALLEWWQALPKRPGERAALARCHSGDEVVLTHEYHAAWLRDFAGTKLGRRTMPAVLALCAAVRDLDNRSLAQCLAQGAPDKSRGLSDLRFRRLLQTDSVEALFPQLRRAINLIGRRAPPAEVAELAYRWQWRDARAQLRKELAYDFYQHLPKKS